MTEFLSLFATGGITGLAGLLGGLSQRWLDIKIKREELKLVELNRKFDLEETKLEIDSALKLSATEAETTRLAGIEETTRTTTKEDAKDFRAALAAEAKGSVYSTPSTPWWHPKSLVDAVRGFIRPAITVWTLYLLSQISYSIDTVAILTAITPQHKFDLAMQIYHAIISLTFLTVGFWFGQRGGKITPSK